MNSSLLLPQIIGFGTIVAGMVGLFVAILRTTSAVRADLRGDLRSEIGRLEGRLDRLEGRIDEQGKDLIARIDKQGAELSSRIDRQGAELSSRMDASETRMDTRMDRLEARVEKGFAEVHADYRDLRSRVDRITDSLAIRGLFPTEQS